MIGHFRKDLELEIGIIQDSLNPINYNLEQVCILSFLILEQSEGKISINDLAQRIVNSMNGGIDINDAKTISTYVVNKYTTYVKVNNVTGSATGQSTVTNTGSPTQLPPAKTPTQILAEQLAAQHFKDMGYNPTTSHSSPKSAGNNSKPQSKANNSTQTPNAKVSDKDAKKKDWSGEITLFGVLFTSISLCYLCELRWGYTFLILFGIFMLIGFMDSFYQKNSKLQEKVNMILFGVLGGALTVTSLIIMFFFAGPRYEKACKLDTIESYQSFINKHPLSSYVSDAKDNQKRLKKLASNRLEHGEQPYSYIYGSNSYYGRSAIKVVAPKNSDLVVLIKEDNSVGEVVAHAYLRSGCSYTFNLPNGTYQTFFYYGSGWNPKKKQGEVTGGFMNNETFSKDNPQELFDAELTYTLQLTTAGNFRTKGSSRGEVF